MAPTRSKTGAAASLVIEPYNYSADDAFAPPDSEWHLAEIDPRGNPIHPDIPVPPDHAAAEQEFERRLAEEARRSFEAGLERGLAQGRAAEREAHAAATAGESALRAEQFAHLAESFAAQGERYLERAEQEVVKLALAIAARILRREAQMDPLLLMGAVRVALGQLAAGTEVRLRVPASDAALWTEAVALLPNRTLRLQIIGEEDMRLGDCLLETEFGAVDLGVRAQLSEIERGFFDRAAASPERP